MDVRTSGKHKESQPNNPYTTEGIPARLMMAIRIMRVRAYPPHIRRGRCGGDASGTRKPLSQVSDTAFQ